MGLTWQPVDDRGSWSIVEHDGAESTVIARGMTAVNVKRLLRSLEISDQHRPVELQTAQFTGSQARVAIENERLKRLNEQLENNIRRLTEVAVPPIQVAMAPPAIPAIDAPTVRTSDPPPSLGSYLREHVYAAGLVIGGAFAGYGVGHWDDPLIVCGLCLAAMALYSKNR